MEVAREKRTIRHVFKRPGQIESRTEPGNFDRSKTIWNFSHGFHPDAQYPHLSMRDRRLCSVPKTIPRKFIPTRKHRWTIVGLAFPRTVRIYVGPILWEKSTSALIYPLDYAIATDPPRISTFEAVLGLCLLGSYFTWIELLPIPRTL